MRVLMAAAGLLLGSAVSVPAYAQLAIDRLWVDFEPGAQPRADVVIRNESADRYYISVSPVEVADPGAENESRTDESDPEKLGLLVSPNRLVIDPGGMRSLRIVSLNNALTSDRVYRVKVVPQVGEIQAADPGAGNRGVSVKLLTAYDLLVTVRPAKAKSELTATRTPTGLTIRNSGNTNTLLFEGQSCKNGVKPGTTADCEDLGARRVYAGNEWVIPMKDPTARVYFKERRLASSEARDVSF